MIQDTDSAPEDDIEIVGYDIISNRAGLWIDGRNGQQREVTGVLAQNTTHVISVWQSDKDLVIDSYLKKDYSHQQAVIKSHFEDDEHIIRELPPYPAGDLIFVPTASGPSSVIWTYTAMWVLFEMTHYLIRRL